MRLTYFGGPAWDAGALPARGRGQESLLFRLAVDAGAAVSVRALSDDLWPVDAPDDPRAAVQSLVSRLRRALGSEAIEAVSGGYRLTLGRDEIDLTRFQDLVAAARRADDPARAAALARDALGLWTADPWVPDDFDWARRDLLEDRAHAERLAGGDHAPVGAGAVGGERIPAALTPLIGRADEIALAEAQLTDERLLTLIGPGGAGKTTLALEIARRHSPAVFVELAPADAGGVSDAVATALGRGVRLSDGTVGQAQGSRERALAALAGRPLLLVLDNAEHVVADAAQVAAEALRVAPALRLLVTSREPLGVPAEAFVNVGSLPEADAVTLLSARIRAARGYAPDAGERAAVARIARRLDGLPLGHV